MSTEHTGTKRRRIEKDPTPPVIKCDIDFLIDIICNENTIKKFVETFGDPEDQNEDQFYDLIRKVVLERSYFDEDNTIEIDNECSSPDADSSRYPRPGDKVSVSYTPASQKYIDHYNEQAFTGEVFFVDPEEDNFFMWNVEVGQLCGNRISLTYRIQSFKREGCHFFGMTDCYFGTFSFV